MVRELQGRNFRFKTAGGEMSVVDNEGDRPPVLFIHGNSACKEVFCHQFNSPLANDYRLIGVDLPGHGASDDAAEPGKTYLMKSIAGSLHDLLGALGALDAVVVGWSLGGHIAIELVGGHTSNRGLVLTGTPPFGPGRGEGLLAFNPTEEMGLTAKDVFSADEAARYAISIFGSDLGREKFFTDAVLRADGTMRVNAITDWGLNDGAGLHQKTVVASWSGPIAVIDGKDEPFINKAWMAEMTWNNLWDGKYHEIEGAGHAPFLEQPEAYNSLLQRYLESLDL